MKSGIIRAAGLFLPVIIVGWGCLYTAPVPEPAYASPSEPIVEKGEMQNPTLDEVLTIAAVDPLQKIFRESSFFPEERAAAEAARSEYATFQFAVRSGRTIRGLSARVDTPRFGAAVLGGATVRFVGYVKSSRRAPEPSHDRLVPLSGYFPDPLLERAAVDVPRDCTQPIWITIPVSKDAAPGVYEGRVVFSGRIEGKTFRVFKPVSIKVFPVTIAKTRLWVTNWFFLEPPTLGLIDGGKPPEKFSPRYWELVRILARKMKDYLQNVAWVHPLDLVKFARSGSRWSFDFGDFDKMVSLLIEEGVAGRIEGGHIGGRVGDWESPFAVNVPVLKPEGTVLEKRAVSDPAAAAFYTQFIPALMSHLREKGWDGIYLQHIADEPTAANNRSYGEIAAFIKGLAPGLKIIEACHSKDVGGVVNVWVPQLNYFADDLAFYQGRQKAGDEVWFYTCLAPQGEYPNRFIELPLLKTRYVHWLNFRYGATGYLHWGFNAWHHAIDQDPFSETSEVQEGGSTLPGGDAWIVYPGTGNVLSSIRLEAMRDGIFDHELLMMIEDRQPEKGQELCRKLVKSFTNYDLDIKSFRRIRTRVLELLSQ